MIPDSSFEKQREQMVRRQILARGVVDAAVLRAMRAVPREHFVDPDQRAIAYEDRALPISEGQTISQPYMVAYMLELLELDSDSKLLEVGAGSGYAAAVACQIVDMVYAVEWHASLARRAWKRLQQLGYRNIEIRAGDGSQGWSEQAPFDAILVSAGSDIMPKALKNQLAIGGHMVIPIGGSQGQTLLKVTRVAEDRWKEHESGGVRFVPLVGDKS